VRSRSISPRMRAPAVLAMAALVALAIGGATHGWASAADVAPIPIAAVAAVFILGGRDTDPGAVIRRQLDERQAEQRLKVQALVGRVLSLAVAFGYIVASATNATLWPWATLLGLLVISFLGGWLAYGERGRPNGRDAAD
jgi:MFS family permease